MIKNLNRNVHDSTSFGVTLANATYVPFLHLMVNNHDASMAVHLAHHT